jgi:RNA polymerase sigma-70 factor (ECF subfamily)
VTLKPTENELFNLCEKGDRWAQLQVYNQYAKGMYHVALRIVKDSAQAEDMMQDSMITAFAKMNQWNREATFGSWLKRIVVNNCLSHVRKEKRMPLTSMENLPLERAIDEQIDMDESGWTAKKVLTVMKELKENYYQVLNLHLIEGMDNEEISEILNISNGMCRTTISRAKASLRTKLQAL